MKFGSVPVDDALGAIVAHGIHQPDLVLKKGDMVREGTIAALHRAGIRDVVVARLEADDLGENEAARCIAAAIAGPNLRIERPFTGRANVFATAAGVLRVDAAAIDHLNGVDEAVTLATLPPFRTVAAGEMVATVKIIPFAVARSVVDHALSVARDAIVEVAPFQALRVGVVSTMLPGLKEAVVGKTLTHLANRLVPAGATIVDDLRVPHDIATLSRALIATRTRSDLVVLFGASAITDRRDVIPTALEAAGGRIEHFGMPVDPGNLLLLGELAGAPVIGAPGCARSPKENGFDWILHRLLAGLEVRAADIRKLGAGGLLMEIVSRPQPRAGDRALEGPREAWRAPMQRADVGE